MGNSISRIEKEFILNHLWESRIPLSLHGSRKEVSGVIEDIDEGRGITILLDPKEGETFKPEETFRIFFSYYGQVMTFAARVLRPGQILKISYPDQIHKNLQRKYERVAVPGDASISFEVKETRVNLQFPKTEEFDPVDKPLIHGRFDTQDLAQLISAFKEETREMGDLTSITMFRGKDIETLEERIVAQTGKVLFIPRMRYGLEKEIGGKDSRFVTEAFLFPGGKPGNHLPDLELAVFREYFSEQYRQGIESIIYCPILFHQYVVGCIHIHSVRDGKPPLDEQAVEYIFQISKIIAYSLKVNGYFNASEEVMNRYTTGLIDISASGLLFANSSPTLNLAMPLYGDLDIELKLCGRIMKIFCRIMRKYPGKKTTYYGLQFLDINPDDLDFLFTTVYGKSRTEHNDTLWEGGAQPPSLSFE
ncbi:MAG: PilZ domain-containing protein [Spirochaetales bacterium]|jgi:hypothetical protein|nr:PilZ domain-containing protein [Spirochaetales bacterium]